MTDNNGKFVYVTYIYTTPQKLWEALTTPEFTRQYWFGVSMESDWKKGSRWKMTGTSGNISDDGTVIESDPPKRLVLSWTNRWKPELTEEGEARCTFTLEPNEHGAVKLTVLHENGRANSKLIEA